MTFLELAEKIIDEEKRPLSPEEIWQIAVAKGYDKSVNTQGKTPWQTIGATIYVDIKDKTDSNFVKAESRPTRFYLRSLSLREPKINDTIHQQGNIITTTPKPSFLEKDLHPFLTYFGYYYLKAY